jgi:hypothetical protein
LISQSIFPAPTTIRIGTFVVRFAKLRPAYLLILPISKPNGNVTWSQVKKRLASLFILLPINETSIPTDRKVQTQARPQSRLTDPRPTARASAALRSIPNDLTGRNPLANARRRSRSLSAQASGAICNTSRAPDRRTDRAGRSQTRIFIKQK